MNRIDRLFGILTLLQTKKYIPAEKIADKFGMSVRTVYRDIKALGELGIPVSFEPAKGYYIVQGYFLPPVSFSTEEANALLLMENAAYSFGDKSIQKHYADALSKVKAVLRTTQKENLETLNQNIRWQVPAFIKHDYDYLSVIQNAITSRTVLQLEYKNNKEEISKRQVESVGLIFYAFNWHLIAWCHERKDYRDFKVGRIIKITDTGLPYKKDKHIELSEYMKLLPVNY